MSELTEAQRKGLAIARAMVEAGIPVFVAARNHGSGHEFLLPKAWQETRPNPAVIDRWRPGMALCAVTGVVADVLDTDPRNGGADSREEIIQSGMWPRVYGTVETPGGGTHEYIHRTRVAKAVVAPGVDLQAGEDSGEGRGFVYLPPTERLARGGPRDGQMVEYTWREALDVDYLTDWTEEGDGTTEHLTWMVQNARARRTTVVSARAKGASGNVDEEDPFDTVWSVWTPESADRVISGQLASVQNAKDGTVNSTLGGAARVLGRFVAGGYLEREAAEAMLLEALARGGVHSDSWNVANGKSWTAATVIGAGMARGEDEPWEVMITQESEAGAQEVAVARDEPGVQPVAPARVGQRVPDLCVTTAAEMTYWLQSALGSGSLSGFFRRTGQVVHTPRVDEAGYVPPVDEHDENGPAQIQAVSPGQLTAKIQYAHRCYKVVKNKETKEDHEVPALFPLEAAKRAVDAPEAMVMLRPLGGVTHTPMVRRDGSILAAPGYDSGSAFLFLPGPGVKSLPVPEVPSQEEVSRAVGLLDEMVAGFPWETKDDKANYYGLLLTPLLRLLAPPSYKAFFIGAHQPGSGKTLLADVARILHGGILRSEMPMDEPEIKKMTTSMLATTSAPVIHVDNVTGVLRSPTLAGLLTSDGELQDRELGSSRNLTFTNDRVWVFTGNNPSLGGDMVRRTITIMIDPNMANPETRSFAIQDLPAWVRERRNQILWSLMVMIRHWVASGRRPAVRQQSDSFATWESVVEGILQACGVVGEFDKQSGQRAAKGGDDDGLAALLEYIWESRRDEKWTTAQLLTAEPDEFRASAQDWLPTVILDKLARSEAGGRRSLGRWLLNRVGRWVTTEDGVPLVIRQAGKNRNKVEQWQVETHSPDI
jgi:hypothetical protein